MQVTEIVRMPDTKITITLFSETYYRSHVRVMPSVDILSVVCGYTRLIAIKCAQEQFNDIIRVAETKCEQWHTRNEHWRFGYECPELHITSGWNNISRDALTQLYSTAEMDYPYICRHTYNQFTIKMLNEQNDFRHKICLDIFARDRDCMFKICEAR